MKKHFCLIITILGILNTCFAEESLSSGEIISVSPVTGQLQYTLPLYTIEDFDFKWPISLSYTSDGFRPYDYSFPVGQNWQFSAGGVISREIIGVADDMDTAICHHNVLNPCTPNNNVGHLAYIKYSNRGRSNITHEDIGSDIYTFTFGSYSGCFVFDSVGNAQILSGDYVDIDATNVPLQHNEFINGWRNTFDVSPSCFILTTLDGYKYYFGSTTSTAPLEYGGTLSDGPTQPIIAWHLHKIVAPNDETLEFHYRSSNQPLWRHEEYYRWIQNINHSIIVEANPVLSDSLDIIQIGHDQNDIYHPDGGTTQLFRYAILDSITNTKTGLSVSFTYAWLNNKVFQSRFISHPAIDSLKPYLTAMNVKVSGQVRKSWTFNYLGQSNIDEGDGLQSRYFLQSATDGCGETYSFDYDLSESNNFPSYFFAAIDTYGYETALSKYGSLISSSNPLGATNNYTYSGVVLDSVRIPFFSNETWRTKTIYYPHQLCHTIRIKTISVTDGTSLLYSKHYNYGEIEHASPAKAPIFPPFPSQNGSGVLNLDYACYRTSGKKFFIIPTMQLHGANTFPITYSQVSESLYDASQTIVRTNKYTFKTDSFTYCGRLDNSSSFKDLHKVINYFQPLKWYHLLKNQKEFDASMQLKSNIIEEYGGPASNNNQMYSRYSCYFNIPSGKYYCTDKTEWHRGISSVTSSNFDSKFRLTFQSVTQGNQTLFARQVYPDMITQGIPHGIPSGIDSCFIGNRFLVLHNMINSPVEIYSGYIDNGVEYTTSGTLVLHKVNIVQLLHNQTLVDFTKITHTLHLSEPIMSYNPIHADNFAMVFTANYDTTSISHYIHWNRLNWEQETTSALRTHYQWSANFMYPISKTIGGYTWSYSYTPYLGVTSETDPRGIVTKYQYDTCGRLMEKYIWRNNQKEILEHYIYH